MKELLKRNYNALKPVLPKPLRREIEGYVNYRRKSRQADAQQATKPPLKHNSAFWERRETPGADTKQIRLGVIGAGQYAQHHLRALTALENVEIAALYSTGAPRAQETAARFHIPFLSSDLNTFLAQDVDAYVVVASAQFLYSVGMSCLATGRPVLLEKPPGANAGETRSLAEQAERFKTFGMVCMNRRFYSALEHGLAVLSYWGPIRGLMMEIPQQITQDRHARRLSDWDYEHYFVRNSIHGVDLVRYILGDPLRVHSLAHENTEIRNAGASFASILEYERGLVATIVDLWDTPQVWRLKVIAEGGWIEFEPLERGWHVKNGREKQVIMPDPIDQEFRPGVYAQDAHFVRAVRQGRKPALPACLLPDACKTMELMEQIRGNSLGRADRKAAEPRA